MAVPSGYVWSREIDQNAYWNPQTKILTVAGKQYKPGEYYLEDGKAYIPNPIPKGYQWIRSYFAPGQVSYDPTTKTINLPGGLNIPQERLFEFGGKTYVSPMQLAQYYVTHAAMYKPPEPTAEDVKKKTEALLQIYSPVMEATRERIGLNLEKIKQEAEAQRRLAEAAYEASRSALERKETSTWNTIMKSAMSRGLGASPLTAYEQRKVAETYAPEYRQLEVQRAAQLANIASQAALAAEELAVKGKELEAQWASKIAEYAYDALQKDAEQQKQALQTIAQYLLALAQAEEEKEEKEKEFGLKEAAITGVYKGAPTVPAQLDSMDKLIELIQILGYPQLGKPLTDIYRYLFNQ